MSNFINTPDVIGEEVATARIIEGTVTEYADDRVNSIGKNAFYKRKQLTSVNFPNATTVGGNAFYGCSALTNVELPSWSTVYNGSSYIFQDCTSLKTVSFPSLTATMDYMFYRCASLISVAMSTVTSLAQGTFLGCAGLTTLDFPKVTSIGTNVFKDCSKLTNLVLRSKTVASLAYNNAFQNTPFASGGSGGRVFVPRALIESYQTASHWSTIYAGGSCQFCAIEDYSVDGTITGEIDWTSMSVARSLVQRTIKSIDSEVITSVGDYAFYYCDKMTSVNMPNVTSVGQEAFYNCMDMVSANMPKVTSIGTRAFCNCQDLTSVDFPELETDTGSYTFQGCSKLASVNVPKLKKVGFWAFASCSSLTSIDLPSVTYIENVAFQNCSALVSVRLPATPPTLNSESTVFKGINSACIFYVPTGSLAAYQADSKWSTITATYSFVEEDR